MENKEQENSDQVRNEQIGGAAGLGAGILTGMRVGTMLIPIPVVGTFLGGLAGGVFGSAVGKRLVPAVLNAAGSFMQTMTEAPKTEEKKEDENKTEG